MVLSLSAIGWSIYVWFVLALLTRRKLLSFRLLVIICLFDSVGFQVSGKRWAFVHAILSFLLLSHILNPYCMLLSLYRRSRLYVLYVVCV